MSESCPICGDSRNTCRHTREAPISECLWCDEPILDGERHKFMREYHHECAVRAVAGSVAHLESRCPCFVPGSECSDDPTLSKRDAARESLAVFRLRYG